MKTAPTPLLITSRQLNLEPSSIHTLSKNNKNTGSYDSANASAHSSRVRRSTHRPPRPASLRPRTVAVTRPGRRESSEARGRNPAVHKQQGQSRNPRVSPAPRQRPPASSVSSSSGGLLRPANGSTLVTTNLLSEKGGDLPSSLPTASSHLSLPPASLSSHDS